MASSLSPPSLLLYTTFPSPSPSLSFPPLSLSPFLFPSPPLCSVSLPSLCPFHSPPSRLSLSPVFPPSLYLTPPLSLSFSFFLLLSNIRLSLIYRGNWSLKYYIHVHTRHHHTEYGDSLYVHACILLIHVDTAVDIPQTEHIKD